MRRADDRVNHGRLGPKDLYGWQSNGSSDRLTTPLVRDPAGAHIPLGRGPLIAHPAPER